MEKNNKSSRGSNKFEVRFPQEDLWLIETILSLLYFLVSGRIWDTFSIELVGLTVVEGDMNNGICGSRENLDYPMASMKVPYIVLMGTKGLYLYVSTYNYFQHQHDAS